MIIKSHNKQGFILSLEDTFLQKPQKEVKLNPYHPPAN